MSSMQWQGLGFAQQHILMPRSMPTTWMCWRNDWELWMSPDSLALANQVCLIERFSVFTNFLECVSFFKFWLRVPCVGSSFWNVPSPTFWNDVGSMAAFFSLPIVKHSEKCLRSLRHYPLIPVHWQSGLVKAEFSKCLCLGGHRAQLQRKVLSTWVRWKDTFSPVVKRGLKAAREWIQFLNER